MAKSGETEIYVAFEEYVPFDPSRPEKNLLRAILQNALADVKKPGEVGRKAREYFLSPDEDYIFAFQSVCNFLNVDPKIMLTVAGLRNGKLPMPMVVRGKPVNAAAQPKSEPETDTIDP